MTGTIEHASSSLFKNMHAFRTSPTESNNVFLERGWLELDTSCSIAHYLSGGLMGDISLSRPKWIPGEKESLEVMRRLAHLRSIRGRFVHLHTSSEAFARRKRKEIELEG